MLNSLADSDFMRLFSPEIYFDNNKDLILLENLRMQIFFIKLILSNLKNLQILKEFSMILNFQVG